MDNIEKVIKDIVMWLRERVEEANAKGLVFGLSGGIDSAVIAGLAKKAFPETALAIMMPIHSNPEDLDHAKLVAEALNLKTETVDLSVTYDTFISASGLDSENRMAKANIKPRLRMTTLYYFAQDNGYLVCGSSNKSEFHVGYFTKHGDSGSDLLPIADFVKYEVKELARALNIPSIVVDKAPSAGLWDNQTDEDEMGFSYDILDSYIKTGEGPEKTVEKIKRMNSISMHKREFPPMYKQNKK